LKDLILLKPFLVAKMTSVRCFLAIAAAKGWELYQMDVNNTFTYGDLDKKVYMTPSPGFRVVHPN